MTRKVEGRSVNSVEALRQRWKEVEGGRWKVEGEGEGKVRFD